MPRRAAPAALAFVLAVLPLTPPPASAAGEPAFAGPAVLQEAPDFAAETFADPWDYTNAADLLVDRGPVINATVTGLRDGQVTFHASGPSHLSLVFPGYDGSLPVGREGRRKPVNADAYDWAAIRLSTTLRHAAGLSWDGCPGAAQVCRGSATFVVDPGWHTYLVPLRGAAHWSGAISGLRLAVTPPSPAQYRLDWVRLYRRTHAVTVSANGDGTVYWDADADRGDNTAEAPGWGPLSRRDDGTWVFESSAHPPGTYRFFRADSGYSAPLEIRATPRLVFEAPSEAGGEDYATARLGDAWDMDRPTDVAGLGNVEAVTWTGGQLHATNGPPARNDPYVVLRHDGPLDAERYHRLTVVGDYDGPFGLADAPGGGMHGRLIWSRVETPTTWEDSKEFVTYSTVDRYVIDLHTAPRAELAEDENGRRIGWTGRMARVRWDPNEDRGARRWRIDEIALRADHEAKGPFDVVWTDTAATPGLRVSLYADRDRSGYDGVLLAPDTAPGGPGVTGTGGRVSVRWSGRSLPAGRWWLYAVATDGTVTGRSYASGPLVVVPAPPPPLRIAGGDRVDTAVRLSRDAYPAGADAVVVARDRDFPDALAAVPLAAAAGGPLLLNPVDRLHEGVRAEIERLGATTVYVMGGTGAQSPAVEAGLRAMGVTVRRLAGPSRYATAAEAARETVRLWGGQAGNRPLLAGGTSFADALAAGPLAAARRQPLLLALPDAMPAETRAAAEQFGAEGVTVLGGEKALASAVAAELGLPVERIAGPSRFDTAVAAASAALEAGASADTLLAASGEAFADALAAGPATVARGGLLVLVGRDLLPEVTHRFLAARRAEVSRLRVAGGGVAVADHVVGALADAAGLP